MAARLRACPHPLWRWLQHGFLVASLGLAGCAVDLTPAREFVPEPPVRFALCFDDGPSGAGDDHSTAGNPTASILDTLASNPVQYGIKAVFFVQTRSSDGGATARGRSLLARERAEGHLVELHDGSPWGHRSHRNLSDAALEQSLADGMADLATLPGVQARLIRPPYWAFDARTLAAYDRHGLAMLLTDITANDGKDWGFRASPRRYVHMASEMARLRQRLLERRLPELDGAVPVIVSFHDTNDYTAAHMAEYLDMLVRSARAAGIATADPPFYADAAALERAGLARTVHDPSDWTMVPWWWRWMLW
jgi:peptidoglycan/xylan/chitin deacetylase (PgdA/CDA1 family)